MKFWIASALILAAARAAQARTRGRVGKQEEETRRLSGSDETGKSKSKGKDDDFSAILTVVSGDWDFLENNIMDGGIYLNGGEPTDLEPPLDGDDIYTIDLYRAIIGNQRRGCTFYSLDDEFFGPINSTVTTPVAIDGVLVESAEFTSDLGLGSLSELKKHDNVKTKMQCQGDLCNFDLKGTASVKVNMKKWLDVDLNLDVPDFIPIDEIDLFTLYGAVFLIQCPASNWAALVSAARKLAKKKGKPLTPDLERRLKKHFDAVEEEKQRRLDPSPTGGEIVGFGADVDTTPEFVISCPRWRQDSSFSSSTFVSSPLSFAMPVPYCQGIDFQAYLFEALRRKFWYSGGFGSPVTHVEALKGDYPPGTGLSCTPATDLRNAAVGNGYTYLVGVGCGTGLQPLAIPPEPQNPFLPTGAPTEAPTETVTGGLTEATTVL